MDSTPSRFKKCLTLFLTFFKIGAFTFGGGYAMIPLIQREATEKRKWISDQELLDIVAVAESTPGPIAINSATFVGSKVAGFPGAFCATSGVVLPSFLIILAISAVLNEFESFRLVQYAFVGIRSGVLALILKALWSMAKACPQNIFSYCLVAVSFLAAVFLPQLNVIFIILFCAAAGIGGAICRFDRKEGKRP